MFWQVFFNAELRTLFLKSVFNDLDCEGLVYSDAAHSTLVATSMGRPSVVWSCPGLGALCNELLFVLLGLFALMPVGLLVDVVLFIAIDLGQAGYCMGVDELVVFIKHPLPLCVFVVLEFLGSFPRCQGCVSLPST